MGRSTDGQLSYGYVFEEGFEFPWDDERYVGDIEDWWRDVKGFTRAVDSPFDEQGNYKPGISEGSPEVSRYYAESQEWDKKNPLPVELVNYCSDGCPMYILASKNLRANRGYPTPISLMDMEHTDEAHQRLMSFLEEFGIVPEGEIGWWLSSYST